MAASKNTSSAKTKKTQSTTSPSPLTNSLGRSPFLKNVTLDRRQAIIMMGLLTLLAVLVVVFVQAAGTRKSLSLSFTNTTNGTGTVSKQNDGSLSFTKATTQSGSGSLLLKNAYLQSWMNARQTIANTTPQACTNLECTERGDNGATVSANGQGQFRVGCQYSHFGTDDPIVYPGQPGKSHLHMFWGNTSVTSYTHFDPNDTSQNSLTKYGGGSCQGAELNRTAYWMPAMFDGTGNVVLPKSIVVYYKSNPTAAAAAATVAMPEGLKMIGGNSKGNTNTAQIGFRELEWNCYDNAQSWTYPPDGTGKASGITIPATCPAGHYLHATISFPQCWDGVGLETTNVAFQDEKRNCPAGWKHMPQVQYIVDYPVSPTGSYKDWYLSSDRMPGQPVQPNGSTLHGDWFGGWNQTVMNTWIRDCVQAFRNCSLGQMGQNNLHLLRLPKDNATLEDYPGPFFVKSPL